MRIIFQPPNLRALLNAAEAQAASSGTSPYTLAGNAPLILTPSPAAQGGPVSGLPPMTRSPAMSEFPVMLSAFSSLRARASRIQSGYPVLPDLVDDDEVLPDCIPYPDDPMVDEPPLSLAVPDDPVVDQPRLSRGIPDEPMSWGNDLQRHTAFSRLFDAVNRLSEDARAASIGTVLDSMPIRQFEMPPGYYEAVQRLSEDTNALLGSLRAVTSQAQSDIPAPAERDANPGN